ncbi:hypothetical protein FRC00_005270 [Tulasnella sp. 408]|nr:hypothetical protein FRC00_005270 [Tulasnella sp. 408]
MCNRLNTLALPSLPLLLPSTPHIGNGPIDAKTAHLGSNINGASGGINSAAYSVFGWAYSTTAVDDPTDPFSDMIQHDDARLYGFDTTQAHSSDYGTYVQLGSTSTTTTSGTKTSSSTTKTSTTTTTTSAIVTVSPTPYE